MASPESNWPAFPTLLLVRAASRLGRVRAQRRSPSIGEGGVVSVFLDGSKVGVISPKQIKVYQVSPGTFLESSLPWGFAAIEEAPCSSSRGRGETVCVFAERDGLALHPARHSQGCRCNGTVAVSAW